MLPGVLIIWLKLGREHSEVLSAMADKEAELTLLATFIPQAPGSEMWKKMLTAWRPGGCRDTCPTGRAIVFHCAFSARTP